MERKKRAEQSALSNLELASFCGEMAMMLKSGISALEGLELLKEDAANEAEEELVDRIYQPMLEGNSFFQSLTDAEVFPEYLIRMTQIGEETGTLDEVMDALSAHYIREEEIRQSIRSAVTYPLIMIGMMLVVILILILKVMPVFNQVFVQLGQELSGFSQGILVAGEILHRYAVFFGLLLLLVCCFGGYLMRSASGRKLRQKIGYQFSFVRTIYEKQAICRFAGGMALTLKSGLMPERGIEFAKNLTEDVFFQKKMDVCEKMIQDGADLSEALVKAKIFTGVYGRMTSIAGRTGKMDSVMEKIADQCEEELNAQIQSIIAVLEPTLVIILSIIAGTILLSVMLPLLGIMSGL